MCVCIKKNLNLNVFMMTTLLQFYAYMCLLFLALVWSDSIWAADIRAALSEGIFGRRERLPLPEMTRRSAGKRENQTERIRLRETEREKACSMLPLIRVSSLQIRRTVKPEAITTQTHTDVNTQIHIQTQSCLSSIYVWVFAPNQNI